MQQLMHLQLEKFSDVAPQCANRSRTPIEKLNRVADAMAKANESTTWQGTTRPLTTVH